MARNGCAVAVDIGGTSTKVALVTGDAKVEGLTSLSTAGPLDTFVSALFASVEPLLSGATAGIGVSVAGFVDDEGSAMIYNPNIPWLQGVPLRREIQHRFGVPVVVDADSNAACVAEYRFGTGRGTRRFLCLAIGTGVGGGMIIDGRVVSLAFGGLGDIGHVIVSPGGPLCGSGCHGCAEAMITSPGIEARSDGRSAREVIDAAHRGEAGASAVVAETGRLLGVAIASQAVILFPDAVAIAGGISEAGELLLAPARAAFAGSVGPFYRNVRIEKAVLGSQASLIGAALPLLPHQSVA
jgi:glucokinase